MLKTLYLVIVVCLLRPCIYQSTNNKAHADFSDQCPKVATMGDPVMMILHFHDFVANSLNHRNRESAARYIYFYTQKDEATGYIITKLVFQIITTVTNNYIGMVIRHMKNDIGGTTMLKFIASTDIKVVARVLDIPTEGYDKSRGYACGDLRYIYTVGKPVRAADRPRDSQGRPINTLAVLGLLNATISPEDYVRSCVTANYRETTDFYGVDNNIHEINRINCLRNKPGIAYFKLGCNSLTGRIRSIQFFYNHATEDTIVSTSVIGDPHTPASQVTVIELQGVDRVQFTSHMDPGVNRSLKISTFNENRHLIQDYSCGTFTGGTRQSFMLYVIDFLGFSSIQPNAVSTFVDSFELMIYNGYK